MKLVAFVLVMLVYLSGGTAVADDDSSRANGVDQALRLTAHERGVLFFFGSHCPYCHRLAPVIKQLELLYGFKVIPVSLDGRGIPGYERPEPNMVLGQYLNVTQVPALFLVDPSLNSVAPIGIGLSTWSELQQNVINASQAMNTTKVLP